MLFRAALAIALALIPAFAAEARIKSLPAHEPLPQAMLISPAQLDAPQAPMQLTTRAGCSCQGQAEACSCSGRATEQCCCAGRAADPAAPALDAARSEPEKVTDARKPRRLAKRLSGRGLSSEKP
jgi:hypothetical protein